LQWVKTHCYKIFRASGSVIYEKSGNQEPSARKYCNLGFQSMERNQRAIGSTDIVTLDFNPRKETKEPLARKYCNLGLKSKEKRK
jgi:hypothetical protein